MGQILEDIICRHGAQSLEPDPVCTTPDSQALPPPRPQLVLNLRRTSSQDTGRTSGGLQSTFSPSPSSLSALNMKQENTPQPLLSLEVQNESKSELDEDEEETVVIKRRGKIRKKKKKTHQAVEKGEKEVTDLIEPNDTLVSTCRGDGTEYDSENNEHEIPGTKCQQFQSGHLQSDLFDLKTLRHLRRSLSFTQMEAEFRKIWRRVLQESLGSSDVLPQDEVKIAEDIQIPPCQPENWLLYPRKFIRSSARFDLPINKRLLNDMKPLQYLRNYVANSKHSMMLYSHIYKKYKEEDKSNCIPPEIVIKALGDVMGRKFTEKEEEIFKDLIDLHKEDMIDYRTWLGLCALSERYYGKQFSSGVEIDLGKKPVIEEVDFESLKKRIDKLKLNPKMLRLLNVISTS